MYSVFLDSQVTALWTKTWYQNNVQYITVFLHFLKATDTVYRLSQA